MGRSPWSNTKRFRKRIGLPGSTSSFAAVNLSAEIALIDHHVDYEPRTVTGFHGESVEALSLGSKSPELNEMIGVHLLIYDLDDLRGALKPDAKGRTPRGDITAVRRLLQETTTP